MVVGGEIAVDHLVTNLIGSYRDTTRGCEYEIDDLVRRAVISEGRYLIDLIISYVKGVDYSAGDNLCICARGRIAVEVTCKNDRVIGDGFKILYKNSRLLLACLSTCMVKVGVYDHNSGAVGFSFKKSVGIDSVEGGFIVLGNSIGSVGKPLRTAIDKIENFLLIEYRIVLAAGTAVSALSNPGILILKTCIQGREPGGVNLLAPHLQNQLPLQEEQFSCNQFCLTYNLQGYPYKHKQ